MSGNGNSKDDRNRDEGGRGEPSNQKDQVKEQKDQEQWNESNDTGNELSAEVDDLEEGIIDEREREGASGNLSERADVKPVRSEDDAPE
ncbi:hypothetical protein [Lolliginicoccus levis]|uniref:hypothetical protein n=1 Tax=Lolliginicoccus levis TaxID=2919542 RepID=UPI00241CE56B|nr:hypothetical protein [Lolliginicoccus levis]